jgi:hypothetical protein
MERKYIVSCGIRLTALCGFLIRTTPFFETTFRGTKGLQKAYGLSVHHLHTLYRLAMHIKLGQNIISAQFSSFPFICIFP